MKSFQQFITEAYDKDLEGQASRAPGEGGRIRASRKKRDLDKTRTKAVGGGKTAPVKDYKPRKDIGTNKPRSRTQQQPEKPRGTAALSPREAQKKAAMERRAAKSGAKTKTADELLSKKKKTVSPKYKPTGKPGHTGTSKRQYTTPERQKLQRAGDRLVKDIQKKKEKPAASYDPKIS
tara:strand:+ start:34 stop:567 length:534 start_codon:yes stop_codon:yes gene_type:complete